MAPFSLLSLLSPSVAAVTQEQGAKAAVLKFCTARSPGGLLKHRPLGPTPTVSDSVGLGCGPGKCISNKFPTGADATVRGPI